MNKYYNAEKVKLYNKKYREDNKEYIAKQKKNAYALHQHNKIKNAVPVICICGSKLKAGSLHRHKKSAHHHKMMQSFELFFA